MTFISSHPRMNTGASVTETFAKRTSNIDYNSTFSRPYVSANALADSSGRQTHAGSLCIYMASLPCACVCDPAATTGGWTLFHKSCIYTVTCACECAFSARPRKRTFSRSTCRRILCAGAGVSEGQRQWRNFSHTRDICAVSLTRERSRKRSLIPCRFPSLLCQWNLRASRRVSKWFLSFGRDLDERTM